MGHEKRWLHCYIHHSSTVRVRLELAGADILDQPCNLVGGPRYLAILGYLRLWMLCVAQTNTPRVSATLQWQPRKLIGGSRYMTTVSSAVD